MKVTRNVVEHETERTAMQSINIEVGQVDLDSLHTEEEIRAEAKKLIPAALNEIGKAGAEILWEEAQKAFDMPGFTVNHSASEKRKFVEATGRSHALEASASDNQELEDYIAAEIQARKSGRAAQHP
jgi:hypothetical protein